MSNLLTNKSEYDIIVVDDDSDVRNLLVEYLTQQGYRVLSANNGLSYKPLFQQHITRLVILDVVMPGECGLTLLAWTKKQRQSPPVLMLSAKGSLDDKVSGLSIGADDYLVKPFEPRELLARVEVILRRDNKQQVNDFYFAGYHYQLKEQVLTHQETTIKLTTGEHQLLNLFCLHQGKILTRDVITKEIKGYDHDPFDRTIDIRITRLRKKLALSSETNDIIRTVRGQGYLFMLGDT